MADVAADREITVVNAPCGEVIGRFKDDALLFAGVPYAQPPVGTLRFKAPQPLPAFAEPFEAFRFGAAAPQVATGGMTDSAPVRSSEDCLTLNISTPACDDAGRAVLVWIHGGGYRTGQSSIPWYAGGRFASQGDIVVVSINYRLGALGFTDLSHLGEEFADSGVNGLKDQIAALHWVQDNIAAFGGDPARVTIAGESAGGFSVSTLLGCSAAQGLFHQVIGQSGAAHHTLPPEAGRQVADTFLRHLQASDVEAIQSASVEAILAAQTATIKDLEKGPGLTNNLGTTVAPFYPVHGTPLLPQSPLEAIRQGTGKSVALLTGSNTHETTLWGFGEVDAAKLNRLAASVGAADTLEAYQQALPDADPEALLVALTSDHMFRIPAIRLAEIRAGQDAQTWMYLFDWRSRIEGFGATHALEIPFTFDNLHKAGVKLFIGPGETPQHVADVMHQAWCAFINHGDPGWARYNTTTRQTMVFNDVSAVAEDPQGTLRAAWEGLR